MNTTVATREQRLTRTPLLTQLARRAVLAQLRKLHTGSLTLVEGQERLQFGQLSTADVALQAEIVIVDAAAYVDIMTGGSIGAGEAFMSGDWYSPDLTAVIRLLARNSDVLDAIEGGVAALAKPFLKIFHRRRQNSEKGSRRNIAAHYDLGNGLFELFLDPTMMYSSGLFPHSASTMEDASLHKLDTICKKLQLNAEDRVIEIGTGWGGFAVYAARTYGCHVTTTTISAEQYDYARQRIAEEGLGDRITLLQQDYRHLEGQFDKLVSIEMIEAVGWEFYTTFFNQCAALLKPDGVMLVQAITINEQRFERAKRDVDFIQRYIFPGGCLPSVQSLLAAMSDGSDLRMIHQEDFAEHYARTLRAWHQQFNGALEQVRQLDYSDEFIRMWRFYLSYCEGGFMERVIGVSQMVFAKPRCIGEVAARY